jgi:hypothetical protein
MFKILIEEDWPVINQNPPVEYFSQPVAMVYYFAFWLPAAVIGKLFGETAGWVMLAIWAAIGVSLFYFLFLDKFIKKLVVWPLVVIIIFSGLDIFGMFLLGYDITQIPSTEHIEWWAEPFQFSSITDQLFWVFNQAIPAWVATMVLIFQKDSRFYAVIVALMLMLGTFPAVCLFFLACVMIVRNIFFIKKPANNMISRLKKLFTPENIAGGGLVGIISVLFLTNNVQAQTIRIVPYNSLNGIVFTWLLFYFVEVGIYLILIRKYQSKNYLYYFAVVWLLLCPWIDMGFLHDFCMRTSIPALIIVMALVVDSLKKCYENKNYKILAVLILVLVIGASTTMREFVRTSTQTVFREREGVQIDMGYLSPMEHPHRNNYYAYLNDNFFFKYLARTDNR